MSSLWGSLWAWLLPPAPFVDESCPDEYTVSDWLGMVPNESGEYELYTNVHDYVYEGE